MRWWSSKPQSVTAQTLDSAAFFTITLLSSHPPHNFFYLFLDRSFRFSLPPELSPIDPHLSSVDAASLSICTRLSSPILPGSGATIHLDGAPASRSRPLVCASLPCWAAQGVPCVRLCLPFLIRFPPLAVLNILNQVPVRPMVLLSRGPFLPPSDNL